MDHYNVFVEAPSWVQFHTMVSCLSGVFRHLRPELTVVNTHLEKKKLLSRFPEEMGLKIVHYGGKTLRNFIQFGEEFGDGWGLMVFPNQTLFLNVVDRYKIFWENSDLEVFVPARNGGLDLSGHLLFMHKDILTKLSPEEGLEFNLGQIMDSITLKGIQGVCASERDKNHGFR